MSTEQTHLLAEEARSTAAILPEPVTAHEATAVLSEWSRRWLDRAAPSVANTADLARAMGVTEAEARELLAQVRASQLRSEVEAVSAAVYRNRSRTPRLVWILVGIAAFLAVLALGFLTISVGQPSSVSISVGEPSEPSVVIDRSGPASATATVTAPVPPRPPDGRTR